MEKIIVLILIISFCNKIQAQNADFIKPGLLRAQLTLSPSYMFSDQTSHFYLHGNLEAYVKQNLSLAGEAYYYLGNTSSAEGPFAFHHSLFFGGSWHFIQKRNDLYIGIQPGISLTKLNGLGEMSTGVNPFFSSIAGYNLFIDKLFHFFVQGRLILGEHNYDIHKSLTELRFSAGLGFHLK